MFMIEVTYPDLQEEIAIARSTTGARMPKLNHVINGRQVQTFQELVRRVPVPDHIYAFAAHLVRRTRPSDAEAPEWIKPLVNWGAGPRAVQYLILGAKSRAALLGSYMVRLEDVVEVAKPVLMHRVITSFGAESEGISSPEIVRRLVEELVKEG
jgi:MoxR-like ATPase